MSLPGVQLPFRFAAGPCLLLHKPQVRPETVPQSFCHRVTLTNLWHMVPGSCPRTELGDTPSAFEMVPREHSHVVSPHSTGLPGCEDSPGQQLGLFPQQHWPRLGGSPAAWVAVPQAEALPPVQYCEGGRIRLATVAMAPSPSWAGPVQQGLKACSGGDVCSALAPSELGLKISVSLNLMGVLSLSTSLG